MMHRLLALLICLAGPAMGQDTVRLAVTTSFHNSGLADVLLPGIKQDLGLDVHLLVVGTGQALRLGRAGDVDAILVHSKSAEIAFVADGSGTHRRPIMYNDFVLIGPSDDPADIATASTAADAFSRVATAQSLFVSRGDDSGTHKKELALWANAGHSPQPPWHLSVGAGMGAALNTAAGLGAYILSDRASWLNFQNKAEQTLLFSGDPDLFNQYAFLPVNPDRHPHVKADAVIRLEDWLTSEKAKGLINSYSINGEPLFTFNATP